MSLSSSRIILYADDDEDDVFFMRRAHQNCGIEAALQTVRDGRTAIAYLNAEGAFVDRGQFPFPHLVLLDVKMAGVGGLDVLAWIRKDPAKAALPVCILTSSSQPADLAQAAHLGANAYVVKPGNARLLGEMLLNLQQLCLAPAQPPRGWLDFAGNSAPPSMLSAG